MKNFLLIIPAFLVCGSVWSQQPATPTINPTYETMVPPSPNAAALSKFGDIPVGPSTGIPSVNIPVYQYKNKSTGLNLNVSLDYHAGGVKINEVASDVGMGWALNAGGVITRTSRGIADEIPSYGFLNQARLPNGELDGNSPYDHLELRPFILMNAGRLDTQNDIFNFNFNGHSGKFLLGKNNDILIFPQQKIKIDKEIGTAGPISSAFTGFVITDENGYKYFFRDYEITLTQGDPISKYSTSSWYLSKIQTPSGLDAITFTYQDVFLPGYITGRNATFVQPLPGSTGGGDLGSYSAADMNSKRISAINFPDGVKINFTYNSAARTDLTGDNWLDKIEITGDGAQPRGFLLAHDYSFNRTTLNSVTPYGGGAQQPPYTMQYYGLALPARFADREDHWGYTNFNSGNFIPQEVFPNGLDGTGIYQLTGGNRDTDPEGVKYGSLSKITYPTGGYTTFEMEANQASDNWLDQNVTKVVNNPTTAVQNAPGYLNTNDVAGTDVATITFNGAPNTTTPFTVDVPAASGTCNSSSCKIEVDFYNANNQLLDFHTIPYSENGGTISWTESNLPAGTYKMKFYGVGLTGYTAYLQIHWTETYPPSTHTETYTHRQPYVGGLRAKTINDYTAASSTIPARSKQYEYLQEDGTTSSGSLGIYPVYSYGVFYAVRNKHTSGVDGYEHYVPEAPNFIVRSSSTITEIAYVNGSPVTYSRVVEKDYNNGNYNGKTERFFTSFDGQHPAIKQVFPFVPPYYYDWIYGLLTKEKIYDKDGFVLQQTENTYNYPFDGYSADTTRKENFRSISIAPVSYDDSKAESGADAGAETGIVDPRKQPLYFRMTPFYPDAGRTELASTTVTSFGHSGQSLQSVKTYTYDQANFYLKQIASTNSKNQQIVNQFIYPADRVAQGNDPTGIYQDMLNRNMINDLVQSDEFNGSTKMKSDRKSYYAPFTAVDVPQTIDEQIAANAMETRLTYNAYDSHGNVISVTPENGVMLSYIYGYNNQLVVAECKNARATDCFYTSFEDASGSTAGNSADGDSKTGRKSATGGFQTTLGNLTGGSYWLTYWQKTGGSWVLVKNTINVTGNQHTISLSGQVDEVRFYPAAATMTTYTYSPLNGLTSQCDAADHASYYQYDGFGRLQQIVDQDNHILKSFDYHYQGQ